MITEIIVLLGFLGSLTGFIFFIKHYLKTWREKNNNKKMLLAIESAEDEYASSDKFYNNVFDHIDFSRIFIFFLVAGLVAVAFMVFASPNKDTSIGNQGVSTTSNVSTSPAIIPTASSLNITDLNQSSPNMIDMLTKTTGVPFWVFIVLGGIIMWLVIRRHRFYL